MMCDSQYAYPWASWRQAFATPSVGTTSFRGTSDDIFPFGVGFGRRSVVAGRELLSAREQQVLERLAAGCTINEIAAEFSLGAKTISTHKMRLMQKLGIDNNADLILYAIENNVRVSQFI